ncbi:MAG: aspartyl protease family protein [Bryobacteraceae bacterium]
MRTGILIGFATFVAAICQAQVISDLKTLYDTHQWKQLDHRLQNTKGVPLYRGAIGVTFNQDLQRSERLLLSVIKSSPHSSEAYEAYEWLSHLYFYRGQYRSLVYIMERRWAAFPEKQEKSQEQTVIYGLRGLPNQTLESTRPSQVTHEPGSIFIPLSIDGDSATYFFDTGAWISCMSESEAKRLRLSVRNSSGRLGQSAGSQVGFRTAVAHDVVVGNTHLKDVSFAVFPDNQEPWSDLPPRHRGIIGMPILIEIQTLGWEDPGTIELAKQSRPFNIQTSNLSFDNDHLVVTATVQNQKINATVDTGATRTDLYKPFAEKFESLLNRYGKKDATEVHGVGHAEKFDSVTLPELRIRVGGSDTVLSPAHVILKSIGANCCVGNFGMDLFKQGRAMKIDFGAMTLQLDPVNRVH